MLGMRPFRRFRRSAAGSGSTAADAQGFDPEAVRLKALQDQLAAWAYDIDQHRAMQRAVLAKMHGLPGTQQSADYGRPFPGSSTTTNNTTTNAGINAGTITGMITGMVGTALLGVAIGNGGKLPAVTPTPVPNHGAPATPNPPPHKPTNPDDGEAWQLIVVPAPGEPHDP